jgi:hypothetical protein
MLGASAFLSKPLNVRVLKRVFEGLLPHPPQRTPQRASNEGAESFLRQQRYAQSSFAPAISRSQSWRWLRPSFPALEQESVLGGHAALITVDPLLRELNNGLPPTHQLRVQNDQAFQRSPSLYGFPIRAT